MRPKKVILCIDDNEQSLGVRKFLLETRGYRVLTATEADGAEKCYRRGGIDLVICDMLMPGVDGTELVGRLKDINPNVPAMLISGSVQHVDMDMRADFFMPKGVSAFELLERIRAMVARKRGPKKPDAVSVAQPIPAGERAAAREETIRAQA